MVAVTVRRLVARCAALARHAAGTLVAVGALAVGGCSSSQHTNPLHPARSSAPTTRESVVISVTTAAEIPTTSTTQPWPREGVIGEIAPERAPALTLPAGPVTAAAPGRGQPTDAEGGMPLPSDLIASEGATTPSGKPALYLTFDDGPSPFTAAILDVLAEHHAKATFFVIGKQVPEHAELVRRIVAEGHRIGNHSWSHQSYTKLGDDALRSQLKRTSAAVVEITGEPPSCARPPYGATNARVKGMITKLGMHQQMWTMTNADTAHRSLAEMIALMNAAAPGSVVLMHDGGGNRAATVAMLRQWLSGNHDRFEFLPLPNC